MISFGSFRNTWGCEIYFRSHLWTVMKLRKVKWNVSRLETLIRTESVYCMLVTRVFRSRAFYDKLNILSSDLVPLFSSAAPEMMDDQRRTVRFYRIAKGPYFNQELRIDENRYFEFDCGNFSINRIQRTNIQLLQRSQFVQSTARRPPYGTHLRPRQQTASPLSRLRLCEHFNGNHFVIKFINTNFNYVEQITSTNYSALVLSVTTVTTFKHISLSVIHHIADRAIAIFLCQSLAPSAQQSAVFVYCNKEKHCFWTVFAWEEKKWIWKQICELNEQWASRRAGAELISACKCAIQLWNRFIFLQFCCLQILEIHAKSIFSFERKKNKVVWLQLRKNSCLYVCILYLQMRSVYSFCLVF